MCPSKKATAYSGGLWFFFSSKVDFTPPGLLSSYRIYGTYDMMFGTESFWFIVILSTVVCITPVFVFMAIKTSQFPTRSDIGREMTKGWYNGAKIGQE